MAHNVLVTGGAGYVGSHICKALAAAGHRPVALDDMSAGHLWALQWGPAVQADVRDTAAIIQALRQHRIHVVVHAAQCVRRDGASKRPDRHYEVNVGGTLAVLQAMREAQVGAIALASSAGVYGSPLRLPVSEGAFPAPRSSLYASRLMGETILADYAAAFGIQYTALRHFSVAGADPDNELGPLRRPESHLFPLAARVSLGEAPHLVVHGDDYATPDGTCIRDYVHVSDVAAAYPLVLGRLLDGRAAAAYNLGSGEGHSVSEVLAAMGRVTGRPLPRQVGPRREADTPTLVADIGRARAELRWTPKFSDLNTLVKTTWAWALRCQQEAGSAG
ncbi:MAG: UDP-glucose 4-epimerase GalE [Deltaproteobacteria bacterium]|nr:MAG: UDP-glucose 4-epimerase GalE [Deltaproteobacteria bacterium]